MKAIFKNSAQFLREVRHELGRVIWPNRAELVGSTLIVLVLVVIFAIYLGAIDFCFSQLANYIFKQFGF